LKKKTGNGKVWERCKRKAHMNRKTEKKAKKRRLKTLGWGMREGSHNARQRKDCRGELRGMTPETWENAKGGQKARPRGQRDTSP